MGFLHQLTTTRRGGIQAAAGDLDPNRAFLQGMDLTEWTRALSAAGVVVTPELSLTLTAMYGGVKLIGMDLSTLPFQLFEQKEDGGKERVLPRSRGFGVENLAYMIRWQPNFIQTAQEFWLSMVAQYLLRGVAYAEIVPGSRGFLEQLLTRHPDRVRAERLPTGRLRYRLDEPGAAPPRFLTQDEMFVIRDLSFDGGVTSLSRVTAGANAIGTAIAAQRAQAKFFQSGMTAGTLATYEGEMDPEDEERLHASISRYAAGVENSFGLMLVPDDVKISNLSVEPDKAQMMLAQEWGVRDVARLLNLPGSKLGIQDAVSYNSQVQAALDYVITTLRPIAVAMEQSVERDLIINKDRYSSEVRLEGMLRGDFEAQSRYLEKFIRNRIMRPSEARRILNMNPDPELDALSATDFKPGQSSGGGASDTPPPASGNGAQGRGLSGTLAVHDNAGRCIRRELRQVTQLAQKHASDPSAWQRALRTFFADQAQFTARTMRISLDAARGYVSGHGLDLEAQGVALYSEDWQRYETDDLAALALQSDQPTVTISIAVPRTRTVRTPTRDPETGRIVKIEEVVEPAEGPPAQLTQAVPVQAGGTISLALPATRTVRTPKRDPETGRILEIEEITEPGDPSGRG